MTETVQIISDEAITVIEQTSIVSSIETTTVSFDVSSDLQQTVIEDNIDVTHVLHEASVVIFGGGSSAQSNSFFPSGW